MDQFQGRDTGNADQGTDPYGDKDWNRIIQALRLWEDRLKDAEELRLLKVKIGSIRKEIMDIMEGYELEDSSWMRVITIALITAVLKNASLYLWKEPRKP